MKGKNSKNRTTKTTKTTKTIKKSIKRPTKATIKKASIKATIKKTTIKNSAKNSDDIQSITRTRSITMIRSMIKEHNKENQELIKRILSINERTGVLKLTPEMTPGIKKRFGNKKIVERQKIINIRNPWLDRSTLFNSLRAMRPVKKNKEGEANQELDEQLREEYEKELFSKPLTQTPEDDFGRVKGRRAITCSNFAKYDANHGLIIFKEPNPLRMKEEDFEEGIIIADQWFTKKGFTKEDYKIIGWNVLWKAGASQVHTHWQILASKEPYKSMRKIIRAIIDYDKEHGRPFLNDWFRAHQLLGVGMKKRIMVKNQNKNQEKRVLGEMMIFTNLDAIRGKETTIIIKNQEEKIKKNDRRELLKALARTINKIYQAHLSIGVNSLNMSIEEYQGIIIARMIDRGSLNVRNSDVAFMELLAEEFVVADDPFKIWPEIKRRL